MTSTAYTNSMAMPPFPTTRTLLAEPSRSASSSTLSESRMVRTNRSKRSLALQSAENSRYTMD